MATKFICRDDFHAYEVVVGSRQPLSSCAELYKTHDDYYTFQFVSRLNISAQAWLTLLMRAGCSIPNHISHTEQIYKFVVNLCRSRQLRFYKLPDIKKYVAMSASNADWGIALVRGPNPHCHTNLRPEIINTAADAEALLKSVEANEDKILVSAHRNNLQDIFPRYDRQNMSRLVDYLVNKKILAYKIPVRRNNNSAKPEEYLPAGGVGDRKVQPIMYKGVEQKPQVEPIEKLEPSKEEILIAKAIGNSADHIAAREKISRWYLENNGYSKDQIAEALGSADGSRVGGVDLEMPVEIVSYPPPDTMFQYVKSHGYPGNWFDPLGEQSPDALGINGDTRTLARFDMPKGTGLQSHSKPILDSWTAPDKPVQTHGGGTQLFVSDNIKKRVIAMNKIGE